MHASAEDSAQALRRLTPYRAGLWLLRLALADFLVLFGTAVLSVSGWLSSDTAATVLPWTLLIWFLSGLLGMLVVSGSVYWCTLSTTERWSTGVKASLVGVAIRDLFLTLPSRRASVDYDSGEDEVDVSVEEQLRELAANLRSRTPGLLWEIEKASLGGRTEWRCHIRTEWNESSLPRVVLKIWIISDANGTKMSCEIFDREGASLDFRELGRLDRREGVARGAWRGSVSYLAEFLDGSLERIERELRGGNGT